jgi:hypothetical protein
VGSQLQHSILEVIVIKEESMAVDDVISNYFTDIADSAGLSIQPASGDEWLVTQLLAEEVGPFYVRAGDGGSNFEIGTFGGNTARQSRFGLFGIRPVRFFLTNSEYIILYNESGGTDGAGYSGIKIKE